MFAFACAFFAALSCLFVAPWPFTGDAVFVFPWFLGEGWFLLLAPLGDGGGLVLPSDLSLRFGALSGSILLHFVKENIPTSKTIKPAMKYGNQFLVKYLANVMRKAVAVIPKPTTSKIMLENFFETFLWYFLCDGKSGLVYVFLCHERVCFLASFTSRDKSTFG